MPRRIVILGGSGFVGHAVTATAVRRRWDVVAFCNRSAGLVQGVEWETTDLCDPEPAVSRILDFFPDAIVNAAAISENGQCEAFEETAHLINVALPARMAMIAHHLGARFIHFSSEQVFDGTDAPYAPTDTPNPVNLYGRLKLMAEREVLRHAASESAVVRLPLMMGDSPSGTRSVHERLLEAVARGERPKLYEDCIRQTTSACNVAEMAIELCERPTLSGLFHWAGSEPLSRLEIGKRILIHFGLSPELVEAGRCDSARYPADLRLDTRTLAGKLKVQPSGFATQLTECHIPVSLAESVAALGAGSIQQPLRRLVRGRDF